MSQYFFSLSVISLIAYTRMDDSNKLQEQSIMKTSSCKCNQTAIVKDFYALSHLVLLEGEPLCKIRRDIYIDILHLLLVSSLP